MKRRALLTSVTGAAVGGCVAAPERTRTAAPDGSPTADPAATDGTPTDSPTAAIGTSTPEPPAVGVPPSETDCPAGGADRVVCYPEVDPADARLALVPSTDEVALPAGDVEFTLSNGTDAAFRTNFYHWELAKRVDGEWFHVAPWMYPEPLMTVPPGGSHAWTMSIDNRGGIGNAGPSSERRISIGGLGGGEYAFSTGGWFAGGGHGNSIGLAARFRLLGDPVALTPTADAEATRDGETVVVTTDAAENDDRDRAAFVVERADPGSEDDVREYVAEQLLRPRGVADPNPLRQTLPFFEAGVETVRLETKTGVKPPFGVSEPYYVEYDGETYRVSVEKPEETS